MWLGESFSVWGEIVFDTEGEVISTGRSLSLGLGDVIWDMSLRYPFQVSTHSS